MKNFINIAALIALGLSASVNYAATSNVPHKSKIEKVAANVNQSASDTAITAKIKALYASEKVFGDKDISVLGVSVETTNGIVHLSGHVASEDQVTNAVKIARSVKGVNRVIFNLQVN